MSKEFSFRSHTVRAYVGSNGELLHIAHTAKIVVRRPDRLLVDATGDDGATKMLYDGKTLVVYDVTQKQYASVPAPGNIDAMLDLAENRMGADFPLADLLSGNPEKSVLAGHFRRPSRYCNNRWRVVPSFLFYPSAETSRWNFG